MNKHDIILYILLLIFICITLYLTLGNKIDHYSNSLGDCSLAGQSGSKCCDGSIPKNGKCSKCSGVLGTCNMGNGTDKKVIVIRHGHDFPDGKPIDMGSYTAYMPSGQQVNYNGQWLSTLGCDEAYAYAKALPEFIASKQYAPIVKVITNDPSPIPGKRAIQPSNPFRTIYDFITNCNIKNVQLTRSNSDINYNEKLDGSLLMCMTSDDLCGKNKRVNNPESGSILYTLQKKFNVPGNIISPPVKGTTVYVFSQGEVKYYHLDLLSKKNHKRVCLNFISFYTYKIL